MFVVIHLSVIKHHYKNYEIRLSKCEIGNLIRNKKENYQLLLLTEKIGNQLLK